MKPSLNTCNWKIMSLKGWIIIYSRDGIMEKSKGLCKQWSVSGTKSLLYFIWPIHCTPAWFQAHPALSVSKHIVWVSIHQKLCQSFLQHGGDFTKHPKQAQCVCCLSMGNQWVSYQTQQPQIIHARSAKLPGKYWTCWHWIQALNGVAEPWSLRKVQNLTDWWGC